MIFHNCCMADKDCDNCEECFTNFCPNCGLPIVEGLAGFCVCGDEEEAT